MIQDKIIDVTDQNFINYISMFEKRKNDILEIVDNLVPELQFYYKKAITQMSATAIISINLKDLVSHVNHIYNVVNSIEYCKSLPLNIIFDYILPYRINDEDFKLYSPLLYKELENEIDEKSIVNTAINTNYWCYSKATYHQADDRTQNALTTIKSGFGRCGEESVLLVSALRSIGIPSRQCYSPFWAHCDDNHAWVEIFTGNKWEFLGACEPEEKLNIGWFNNAASRAGIIRHRVFGFNNCSLNSDENHIFTTKTSTDIYIHTKKVTIKVLDGTNVASYAKVGMYTINYCIPSLILEKTANDKGIVEFEVGMGEYLFFSSVKNKYDIKALNENDIELILDLSKCPNSLEFNLIPFEGTFSSVNDIVSDNHIKRLKNLLLKRESLHNSSNHSTNKYINLAQLNSEELEKFLNCTSLTTQIKNNILDTLTQKDFTDITYEVLMDMSLSYVYKDKFSSNIFLKYILPLRVGNEPLYVQRAFIRAFFKDKKINSPIQVYNYLISKCTFMDSYNYVGLIGDIKAVLKYNIVTKNSLPIHVVQICRALGIPARLNSSDGSMEYFDGDYFKKIIQENLSKSSLVITNTSAEQLTNGVNFTICKLEDGYFSQLKFDTISNYETNYSLSSGLYAVSQSARQIDGSNIGSIKFINLTHNDTNHVSLNSPINNTKQKLKSVPIPKNLDITNSRTILAYIENESEPTEHFLNELLENEQRLKQFDIKVILFSNCNDKNETILKVLENGLASYNQSIFNKEWEEFRYNMCIGDLRLPFITAVKDNVALYSFANYNVGTVDMLVKIFETVNLHNN
ncbi:transglutaminase domain-containing protein [Sedimentibacter sp. zth1]|uniref:transglutaminase-like domain-containing protein n=1 Tax=Sedimentibacter sp. zth1 TaxID=2816908 RepID=UPI001A91CE80|nr:transglutaminase-like domain-containing protein [Sedimentibacter sp. zth1]QSX05373.1 transglutaminase domain-containing protein [Sedimentibacter sp. zth1]